MDGEGVTRVRRSRLTSATESQSVILHFVLHYSSTCQGFSFRQENSSVKENTSTTLSTNISVTLLFRFSNIHEAS